MERRKLIARRGLGNTVFQLRRKNSFGFTSLERLSVNVLLCNLQHTRVVPAVNMCRYFK